MTTIRRASAATGHLVWGTAQPITPVDLNAKPPDPKPPDPPHPKPPDPPSHSMQPLPGQQTIVSPFSYDEFIQNNPSEVDYYAEAYRNAHGNPPAQKDLAQCFYRRLFEGWQPARIWDDIYVGAGKPIPPGNPFK